MFVLYTLNFYHVIGGNQNKGLAPLDSCVNYSKVDTP